MATGFVQRFKGKIALAQGGMSIAGVAVSGSGADFNLLTGWAAPTTAAATPSTLSNSGISNILSTAINVWPLAAPTPGCEKVIFIQPGSTAWMVKTQGAVILGLSTVSGGGSTLCNVIKSTTVLVSESITLLGLSTSAWLFDGVAPVSTTSGVNALLFSTTT